MYDWPETRSALDEFWKLIRTELVESNLKAPQSLSRGKQVWEIWKDPNLLIGQTCGWPFANFLSDKTQTIARFDYGLYGCPKGHYQSVFIASHDVKSEILSNFPITPSHFTIAANGPDSQSGYHVWKEITEKPIDQCLDAKNILISRSHRNSVAMVASGKANLAAVDAISFRLSCQHDQQHAKQVRIVGKSAPVPGLPLITNKQFSNQIDVFRKAINNAFDKLPSEQRVILGIQGIIDANCSEYRMFR